MPEEPRPKEQYSPAVMAAAGIAAAAAADLESEPFPPNLESEPFPPPHSNAARRLMWVRALAQQQNERWAIVQLADLVQELFEWRDREHLDSSDGSDWSAR